MKLHRPLERRNIAFVLVGLFSSVFLLNIFCNSVLAFNTGKFTRESSFVNNSAPSGHHEQSPSHHNHDEPANHHHDESNHTNHNHDHGHKQNNDQCCNELAFAYFQSLFKDKTSSITFEVPLAYIIPVVANFANYKPVQFEGLTDRFIPYKIPPPLGWHLHIFIQIFLN